MIRVILIQLRESVSLAVFLLLARVTMEFVAIRHAKWELARMYVDGCVNVSDRGRSCYDRDRAHHASDHDDAHDHDVRGHVSDGDDANDRDDGDGDCDRANDRGRDDDAHVSFQADSMQPSPLQNHSKTQ